MSYKDTLPHKQKTESGGYSIRIGERVPDGNVNLAYVGVGHGEDMPIGLDIANANKYKNEDDFEMEVFVDTNYSLRTSHSVGRFYTDDIKITNIYSNDGYPLYYTHASFEGLDLQDKLELDDSSLTITNVELYREEGEIPEENKYKIDVIDNTKIKVYTNFKNRVNETYRIKYDIYSEEDDAIYEGEDTIVNPTELFEQVEMTQNWPQGVGSNKFALVEQSDGYYNVFVTERGISEPSYARNPDKFRFDIKANIDHRIEQLDTHPDNKDSPTERSTLKLGIIPMFESDTPQYADIFMQTIKQSVPDGIVLKNPYPYGLDEDIKSDQSWIETAHEGNQYEAGYWETKLSMPIEHYLKYDMLIIFGQGSHTITQKQRGKLEKYLESGGKIYIDNSTNSIDNTLNISNMPISFQFNELDEEDLEENKEDYMNILNRYNDLSDINTALEPSNYVLFDSSGEEISDYQEILKYNNYPCLIVSEYKDRGLIFTSSNNLLKYSTQEIDSFEPLFLENLLIRMTEYRWDYVGEFGSAALDIDSLLSIDYNENGYTRRDMPFDTVALKNKTGSIINYSRPYITTFEGFDDVTLYVNIKDDDVYYYPTLISFSGGHDLWFRTNNYSEPWDIDSETLERESMNTIYPQMSFTITFDAMYYNTDTEEYEYSNYLLIFDSVSELDGNKIISTIEELDIPPISGDWHDESRTFYRFRLGQYDSNGEWEPADKRITLGLKTYDNKIIGQRDEEVIIDRASLKDNYSLIASIDHYYKATMSGTYTVNTEAVPIYITEPVIQNTDAPWYIRVRDGQFNKQLDAETSIGDEGILDREAHYLVPKFKDQLGEEIDGKYYRKVEDDIAEVLDYDKIQLSYMPLSKIHDIKIRNKDSIREIKREKLNYKLDNEFESKNKNWVINPPPIIYHNEESLSPLDYEIDYEQGKIILNLDIEDNIYADYSYIEQYDIPIKDIEPEHSIIELEEEINLEDEILADYWYEENYFHYKGYEDDNGNFWYLDLNPKEGHGVTYPHFEEVDLRHLPYIQTRMTYGLLIGIEYDSVQGLYVPYMETDPELHNDYAIRHDDSIGFTMGMDNDGIYITTDPRRISMQEYIPSDAVARDIGSDLGFKVGEDAIGPTSIVPYSDPAIVKTPVKEVSSSFLVNKEIYMYMLPYSIEGTLPHAPPNEENIRHTFGEEGWERVKKANPEALLLGKVKIRERIEPEDINIIDTRTRGGGIKSNPVDLDEVHSIAMDEDKPSPKEHYWDVAPWHGEPYQYTGISIIKLPKKVKKRDNFNSDNVKEIIDKYIAYGIVPVVKYTEWDSDLRSSSIVIENTEEDSMSAEFFLPELKGAQVEILPHINFGTSTKFKVITMHDGQSILDTNTKLSSEGQIMVDSIGTNFVMNTSLESKGQIVAEYMDATLSSSSNLEYTERVAMEYAKAILSTITNMITEGTSMVEDMMCTLSSNTNLEYKSDNYYESISYETTIGDGENDVYMIEHNLRTRDVRVTIKEGEEDVTNTEEVEEIEVFDENRVVIRFRVPPEEDQYDVIVEHRPD